MNTKPILDTLKRLPITDFTTKTLYESGFSKHMISKLVADKTIIRTKRGHYLFSKNSYQAMRSLEKGTRMILRNNRFAEALECFQKTIDLREDNMADLTIAAILSLAKYITGMDMAYDELLNALSYQDQSDESQLLTDYKYQIIAGDYLGAFNMIRAIKDEDEALFGNVRATTHNLHNLLNKAYDKLMLDYYHKYVLVPSEELSIEEERLFLKANHWRRVNFMKNYQKLIDYLAGDNLEAARLQLDKLMHYTDDRAKETWQTLYHLLDVGMLVKDGKLTLNQEHYYATDPEIVFAIAMKKEDYLTAQQLKDKVKVPDYEARYFHALSLLLDKIAKRHQKRRIPKGITNAVKKENVEMAITINDLEKLVYDKDYEKALQLCNEFDRYQKTTNKRVFNVSKRLIMRLLDVQGYKLQFTVIEPQRRYAPNNIFSAFYEALDNLDFKEAHLLAQKCKRSNELMHRDTHEFTIYEMILGDLNNAIAEYERIKPLINRFKIVRRKIRDMYYEEGNLTEEEIMELIALIEEEDQLTTTIYGINKNHNEDMHLLAILKTMLKLRDNYGTSPTYFNTYNLDSDDIMERFEYALYYGDYHTAFLITQDTNWYDRAKENLGNPFPRAYQKLLFQLKTINMATCHNPELQVTHIEIPNVDILHRLRYLLKKGKYQEAYDYYLSQDFSFASDELSCLMKGLLPFLVQYKEAEVKPKQYQITKKTKED